MKNLLLSKNLILFILTIFTIGLYTVNLDFLPYVFHGDEAETALQAQQMLQGKVGIIGVGWYDLPLLSFLPNAIIMMIFGENVFGHRIGSVIFGLLTLPIFYAFATNIYNQRISLIATFLLGTSHIWIALSRVGVTYVQATFLVISCFYFISRGVKKNDYMSFFFAGIFLGLCLYSYYAGRIIFLILPFLFISFPLKNNLKKRLYQVLILIITTLIIFAPQGNFFLKNSHAFNSRVNAVYLFSGSQKEWREHEYPNKTNSEILFLHLKKTLNVFLGDNSGQYGYKGQIFDYVTLFLFLLGVVYISLFFKRLYIFLVFWIIASIVFGQVLTTSPAPIFLPRFVVGLPVFFLFCAFGFELIFKVFSKQKNITTFVTIIILFFIYIFNLVTYFITYPKQLNNGVAGDLNALNATNISYFINSFAKQDEIIFLTAPSLYADFSTLRFLSSGSKRITYENLTKNVLGTSIQQNKTVENKVFVLYPNSIRNLSDLSIIYPYGDILEQKDINGNIQFIMYRTKKIYNTF